MNLDLYKSEFRNFKYLKSSAEDIAYYKRKASEVNRIQLGSGANDPTFVWPCRLEFIEQLLDLRDNSIYIVQPCAYFDTDVTTKLYGYDEVRVYTIHNPLIVHGNPLLHPEKLRNILTENDIQDILSFEKNYNFFVCPLDKDIEQVVIRIRDIGLLPSTLSHVSVFYNKEWADKYQKAVTDYLRKGKDAVSAITRLF